MSEFLVLGDSGLLGKCLMSHLKLRHKVRGISRTSSDIPLNLFDKKNLQDILMREAPQTLINTVALTNVDLCESNKEEAHRLNVRLPEMLTEMQNEYPFHIIHISTDMMYEGLGIVAPVNEYALTKLQGEKKLDPSRSTVLRTNFFGKGSETRKSFSDWIFEKLKSGEEIPLLSDVYFSPLHLKTLCEMIEKAALTRVSGIYNLGSHEGLSKMDFALEFSRALGGTLHYRPVRISELGLKTHRPCDMRMNSMAFEQAFHVQLPTLIQEIELCKTEYQL